MPRFKNTFHWWQQDEMASLAVKTLSSVGDYRDIPARSQATGTGTKQRVDRRPYNNIIHDARPPLGFNDERSHKQGLPVKLIQEMCLKVTFRAELFDSDFSHALTALDYLYDLDCTRRSQMHEVALRLGVKDEDWGYKLSAHRDAKQWVEEIEKMDSIVKELYARATVGIRVWTMIAELKSKPFYKTNFIAMLNTLLPHTYRHVYNQHIRPYLRDYRKLIYDLLLDLEKDGDEAVDSFIAEKQQAGSTCCWAIVRQYLADYIELANIMIEQAFATRDVESFCKPRFFAPASPSYQSSPSEKTDLYLSNFPMIHGLHPTESVKEAIISSFLSSPTPSSSTSSGYAQYGSNVSVLYRRHGLSSRMDWHTMMPQEIENASCAPNVFYDACSVPWQQTERATSTREDRRHGFFFPMPPQMDPTAVLSKHENHAVEKEEDAPVVPLSSLRYEGPPQSTSSGGSRMLKKFKALVSGQMKEEKAAPGPSSSSSYKSKLQSISTISLPRSVTLRALAELEPPPPLKDDGDLASYAKPLPLNSVSTVPQRPSRLREVLARPPSPEPPVTSSPLMVAPSNAPVKPSFWKKLLRTPDKPEIDAGVSIKETVVTRSVENLVLVDGSDQELKMVPTVTTTISSGGRPDIPAAYLANAPVAPSATADFSFLDTPYDPLKAPPRKKQPVYRIFPPQTQIKPKPAVGVSAAASKSRNALVEQEPLAAPLRKQRSLGCLTDKDLPPLPEKALPSLPKEDW